MNNTNGAALLARVKAGDLVTVRTPSGSLLTGRYRENTLGLPLAIAPGGRFQFVTAGNIIRVQP